MPRQLPHSFLFLGVCSLSRAVGMSKVVVPALVLRVDIVALRSHLRKASLVDKLGLLVDWKFATDG